MIEYNGVECFFANFSKGKKILIKDTAIAYSQEDWGSH